MISVSENVAAPCDSLPPLGPFSDRQAAHYYGHQHDRAVQREEQWKAKALAAEKIIAQLLVLLGWCVQQIQELKRQLAWLKKQGFGRKSEETKTKGAAGSPQGTAEPSGSAPGLAEGVEQVTQGGGAEGASPTKRGRGQQPGGKGPKRRACLNSPEETTHHTLPEAERTCGTCGTIRPESGLTEGRAVEAGWV